MSIYDPLINKILQHFAGPAFKDELEAAKKEFFGGINVLEEKSGSYEMRLSQLFDWYFFSRELSGHRRPPLIVARHERELRFTPEEDQLLELLLKHQHSIYEFKKIKGEDVHIYDLLRGQSRVVAKSPWIFGFEKDELFEARLIPTAEGGWIFARGVCFHPAEAKPYILSEVKKYKKDIDLHPEELLLRLAKMRSKYEKYRHVQFDAIYSNEPKLNL